MEKLIISLAVFITVIGIIVLVSYITGRITMKKSPIGYVVIPAKCNDLRRLEKLIRSVYWEERFDSALLWRKIIILKLERCDELDGLCDKLCNELKSVEAMEPDELSTYIRNENE